MRSLLVYFFILQCLCNCFGQAVDENIALAVIENNKYGLINISGDILSPCIYDYIEDFDNNNSITSFKIKGKYGIISKSGNVLFEAIYSHVTVINDSLVFLSSENGSYLWKGEGSDIIAVSGYDQISPVSSWPDDCFKIYKEGMAGILNREGDEILQPDYHSVQYCKKNGCFIFKRDTLYGAVSKNGKKFLKAEHLELMALTYDHFIFEATSGYGIITFCDTLIPPKYMKISRENDLIFLRNHDYTYDLYNISEHKNVLSDQRFESYQYADNRNVFCISNKGNYGIIDLSGNLIIPVEYNRLSAIDSTHYLVIRAGKQGLYTKSGQRILEANYDKIISFPNNVFIVHGENKMGLASSTGMVTMFPGAISIKIADDVAKVNTNSELILVFFNDKGETIDQSRFTNFSTISVNTKIETFLQGQTLSPITTIQSSNGWFRSNKTNLWGLKDTTGQIRIQPVYTEINVDNELGITVTTIKQKKVQSNMFRARRNNVRFVYKKGIVDHKNYEVIHKNRFGRIELDDLKEGNTVARFNYPGYKRFGYLDLEGNVSTDIISYIDEFHDGTARVIYKGNLIKPKHDYLSKDEERISFVPYFASTNVFDPRKVYSQNGTWGFIDKNGRSISSKSYQYADRFKHGAAIVKKNNKWGLINKNDSAIVDIAYDHVVRVPFANDSLIEIGSKASSYGIMSSKGSLLTMCIYQNVSQFKDNNAKVRRDGKYGFVNNDGIEITACKFKDANDFSEGMAAVRIRRLWGFIDTTGNLTIKPIYSFVGDFHDGRALIYGKGRYYYISTTGDTLLNGRSFRVAKSFHNKNAIAGNGKRNGILNTEGEWITKPRFKFISRIKDTDFFIVKKRKKYGVVNSAGKKILAARYDQIFDAGNGYFKIRRQWKDGLADSTGKIVLKPVYKKLNNVSEGRIAFKSSNKWGFLNLQGDTVVKPVFYWVNDFNEGRAIVRSRSKFGVVDTSGKVIMQLNYDFITDFSEGKAFAEYNRHGSYVDTDGNILSYPDLSASSEFNNGVACIKHQNGYMSLMDSTGVFKTKRQLQHISHLNEDKYIYSVKYYYGISNCLGEIIVPCQYERIEYISSNIIKVTEDSSIGYLNSNGNWIWKPKEWKDYAKRPSLANNVNSTLQ